jgi:hypothetical protein
MTDQTPAKLTRAARHHAAVAAAKASPAQYVPRHVTTADVHQQMAGDTTMGRFNSRLAVLITRGVGTMWAGYLFVLIALVSLPQALAAFLAGDTVTGITWLSQSFLQLVLLPVIMVGQRVISDAQDLRAEADHETLTALHQINVQQLRILEELEGIRKSQSRGQ